MHGESSEGFNIGVPMVKGVDVLIQGLDVDEAMGKVEVEVAIHDNPESSQGEHGHVPGVGEGLLVAHEGKAFGCVAVHEDSFPDSGPLPGGCTTCCGSPYPLCIVGWDGRDVWTILGRRGKG